MLSEHRRPRGKGINMTNCKIKVMVLMENVPEDKKAILMEKIAENIKKYSDHLGCALEISVSE